LPELGVALLTPARDGPKAKLKNSFLEKSVSTNFGNSVLSSRPIARFSLEGPKNKKRPDPVGFRVRPFGGICGGTMGAKSCAGGILPF
jgi:hypothetical protein